MVTMDTTATARRFTPNTSTMMMDGRAKMGSKVLTLLWSMALLHGVALGQVRESGRSEVQATRPQGGQAGNTASVPEPSLRRDSFSTTVTGAQAALGPGDLLEITVFDTPELAQRTRVSSEG